MKLLAFLFLILPFSGNIPESTPAIFTEPSVTVSVELADGTDFTKTFPTSEWNTVLAEDLDFDPSEVIVCHAVGSNGQCATTAPNCNAAIAGTIACLKVMNGETP